ncbi:MULTISPECIES: hypothetical protein [Pseudomonas]|uniref:hypothetical protein n=1 Tax=Pseudomonas TaxID=286 RepID=UPI002D21D6BD|nr:hypothetical protein [Pseudomonas sp. LY10J]
MGVDQKFIEAIFEELLEKNFNHYSDSLSKAVNSDNDPYGKARAALAKLSDTDKYEVINFLKLVIADTGSVIFGKIDGVHFPDNIDGDFSLTYDGDSIQGDLMGYFY